MKLWWQREGGHYAKKKNVDADGKTIYRKHSKSVQNFSYHFSFYFSSIDRYANDMSKTNQYLLYSSFQTFQRTKWNKNLC